MLKSFFLQSRQSFFLLLYFGVMPSLLGSTLAGFCLKNASDIQNLSFGLLFSLNFLASFGLGLGKKFAIARGGNNYPSPPKGGG